MNWPEIKLTLAAIIVLVGLWKMNAAVGAVGMALGAHARIDALERK